MNTLERGQKYRKQTSSLNKKFIMNEKNLVKQKLSGAILQFFDKIAHNLTPLRITRTKSGKQTPTANYANFALCNHDIRSFRRQRKKSQGNSRQNHTMAVHIYRLCAQYLFEGCTKHLST